jgi:ATP-dependent Lon protease
MPRMQTWMFGASYGFIVDYLAGVLRELRASSHATAIDRWFALGPAVDKRDDKAVRRTVSGLLKLVFPHGDYTREEVEPFLLLALEGRRRVKEQLKRMGGLEFWNTHFRYGPRDAGEPGEEVTLPERVEERFLATTTLPPGGCFCIGRDRGSRRTCLFRVEVEKLQGTGKHQLASPTRGGAVEALRIAYDHLKKNLSEYGVREGLSLYDLRVQISNPMEADEPSLLAIPIFVAMLSALRGEAVAPWSVVAGDMSVQGHVEGMDAVGEVLLLAHENGARKLALPKPCEAEVNNSPPELREGLALSYYSTVAEVIDDLLPPRPVFPPPA